MMVLADKQGTSGGEEDIEDEDGAGAEAEGVGETTGGMVGGLPNSTTGLAYREQRRRHLRVEPPPSQNRGQRTLRPAPTPARRPIPKVLQRWPLPKHRLELKRTMWPMRNMVRKSRKKRPRRKKSLVAFPNRSRNLDQGNPEGCHGTLLHNDHHYCGT